MARVVDLKRWTKNMQLLLLIGPVIVATCFRHTQKNKKGGLILFFAWTFVTLLSAAIGAMLWSPSDESSRFASSAFLASPALFLGPLLLGLRSKSIPMVVLCIITVLVPVVSVVGAFFLLAASGQIWGM